MSSVHCPNPARQGLNLCVGALMLICGVLPLQASEVMTNESVIALARAGLGEATLLAKVRSTPGRYDTSTAGLLQLSKAKVPESVIAAMLGAAAPGAAGGSTAGQTTTDDAADPVIPRPSGIYLHATWAETPRLQRIDPTSSTQTKNTGRIASALTFGAMSQKLVTVLPTPSARIRVQAAQPAFYFYFDRSDSSLSSTGQSGPWGMMPGGQQQPVTSPNEFALIRFEIKKSNREVVLLRQNISGTQAGVMDTVRIDFTYEDVAPGIFKVTPSEPLPPGEYAFVYASAGAGNMMNMYGMGGQGTRIFDFGVD